MSKPKITGEKRMLGTTKSKDGTIKLTAHGRRVIRRRRARDRMAKASRRRNRRS